MFSKIEELLKEPVKVVDKIKNEKALVSLSLHVLFLGLIFHAVYGFAVALFDSLGVASLTALKAPFIVLCTMLLCLPSLYIFSCLSEMHITMMQTVSLGACITALSGLLLMGLVPVSWLFSVSTMNLPFVVFINLCAWFISVCFSFKILRLYGNLAGKKSLWGLRIWLLVFLVVSLQMATTIRPLLGKAEKGWFDTGKKFFLIHYGETCDID